MLHPGSTVLDRRRPTRTEDLQPGRSLASQSPPTNITPISGPSLRWWPVARARDCALVLRRFSPHTSPLRPPLARVLRCRGRAAFRCGISLVGIGARQAVPLGAQCAPPRSHLGARWWAPEQTFYDALLSGMSGGWVMWLSIYNSIPFNSAQ